MDNRLKSGIKAGIIGISLNTLLFIFKLSVGYSSGSNAIVADAFNNLSDSLNSVITVVGFMMASKPADKEHPYGHGRMELIGGLIMCLIMAYIGLDVLQNSVNSLWNREVVTYTTVAYIVMFVSILFKGTLFLYYKWANRKVESDVLVAGAQDSLNDVLISMGILLGIVIQAVFKLDYIDGLIGIIIALVILYSSIKLIKGFVDDLTGYRPNKDMINDILEVISHYDILGYHDLMIHKYGEAKTYASVHIELPASLTLVKAHDIVDSIERDVKKNYNIDLLIHLDPVDLEDNVVITYAPIIKDILDSLNGSITYHDMRFIHNQLMFDIVVDDSYKMKDSEIRTYINQTLKEKGYDIHTQIQIDRNSLLD